MAYLNSKRYRCSKVVRRSGRVHSKTKQLFRGRLHHLLTKGRLASPTMSLLALARSISMFSKKTTSEREPILVLPKNKVVIQCPLFYVYFTMIILYYVELLPNLFFTDRQGAKIGKAIYLLADKFLLSLRGVDLLIMIRRLTS